MEEILKEVAKQIPALTIFVAFALAVYRLQSSEREARDTKWREFLAKEGEARSEICARYLEATKIVGNAMDRQSTEFSGLKKAVSRQTATILYTINQKETNGEKMGIRELVELLSEGI